MNTRGHLFWSCISSKPQKVLPVVITTVAVLINFSKTASQSFLTYRTYIVALAVGLDRKLKSKV